MVEQDILKRRLEGTSELFAYEGESDDEDKEKDKEKSKEKRDKKDKKEQDNVQFTRVHRTGRVHGTSGSDYCTLPLP